MKKFTFLIVVVLLVSAGCSKKLKQTDTKLKEIEQPFQSNKYFSDKKHFRSIGEGRAQDLTVAKRIAETNARQSIASQIEVKVRSVGEQYLQNRSFENRLSTNTKYEEITRTVIDQILPNIEIFDQKSYQNKKGDYVHYVAMQMSTSALANRLENNISVDEQLKQDFELDRFREIYEEELNNFSEGNN
ncbi:MAG TPA: LPP20 family lipoprotein [Cyclobacteriaceae bacterium]